IVTGAVGLLGLVNTIIQARDTFQRVRNFDMDYETRTAAWDMTLVRLQRWLVAVGAASDRDLLHVCPELEWPEVTSMVNRTGTAIGMLHADVDRMRSRYGTGLLPASASPGSSTGSGTGSGANANTNGCRPSADWVSRFSWALWGSR